MICNLLQNLNFLSAFFGLIGTILIFFFGLPPKIDKDGHIHLILEQEDSREKEKAKKYTILGRIGLGLLIFSFLLQLINSFNG
jgi:hypothetical protein